MKCLSLLLVFLGVVWAQKCDPSKCNGSCRCMSTESPGSIPLENTPQLVMLTFDNAVNVVNFPMYKEMFLKGKKNPSDCNIGATFFVSHEYNNYAHLHQLWSEGSEIAVHKITQEGGAEMWKLAPADKWENEAVGMRTLISKLSLIPIDHIKGFRAPFLQTAGNITFDVLHKAKFLYDNSLPTRKYAGENKNTQPIWPYTMDYKNSVDCIMPPCPTGLYPGLWEVPLVNYFRLREVSPGVKKLMPCNMADACLPFPVTADDTYSYFMDNFNRHYEKNRAPFPLFLQESWLREPGRREGYMKFFEFLLKNEDVYIVPIQEVVEYIKDPKPIGQYKEKGCVTTPRPTECTEEGQYCYYELKNESTKVMFVCGDSCPEDYPSLENWSTLE